MPDASFSTDSPPDGPIEVEVHTDSKEDQVGEHTGHCPVCQGYIDFSKFGRPGETMQCPHCGHTIQVPCGCC